MLSFWEKDTFLEYDALVVGGGLVGLSTTASLLEAHPHLRVLVLERGLLPTGASTKNAGFACFGSLTEILSDIERVGQEATLALIEQRWQGLQALLARLGSEAIGYEPLGGYELLTEAQSPALAQMEAVNDLLAPLLGQRVFRRQDADIQRFGFSEQIKTLLFNPLEGQLHTGKMMQRLQHYVQQKGAVLLTGAEVGHLQSSSHEVEVEVNNFFEKQKTLTFKAKKVFVCTNAFSKQLFPHLDLQPGRGQVLMTSPIADLPFRGAFHFEEGYYYFRNVGQAVLFGGGRHRAMEAESTTEMAVSDFIMDDLEEKLREVILPHRSFEIQERWAGVMAFNTARKPIIEEVDKGIVLGLCLNGMGVAIGTEVGARLAERW